MSSIKFSRTENIVWLMILITVFTIIILILIPETAESQISQMEDLFNACIAGDVFSRTECIDIVSSVAQGE